MLPAISDLLVAAFEDSLASGVAVAALVVTAVVLSAALGWLLAMIKVFGSNI